MQNAAENGRMAHSLGSGHTYVGQKGQRAESRREEAKEEKEAAKVYQPTCSLGRRILVSHNRQAAPDREARSPDEARRQHACVW
jgi:hypothetical protein